MGCSVSITSLTQMDSIMLSSSSCTSRLRSVDPYMDTDILTTLKLVHKRCYHVQSASQLEGVPGYVDSPVDLRREEVRGGLKREGTLGTSFNLAANDCIDDLRLIARPAPWRNRWT